MISMKREWLLKMAGVERTLAMCTPFNLSWMYQKAMLRKTNLCTHIYAFQAMRLCI